MILRSDTGITIYQNQQSDLQKVPVTLCKQAFSKVSTGHRIKKEILTIKYIEIPSGTLQPDEPYFSENAI